MSDLDCIGPVAHAPFSAEDLSTPACPNSACAWLETQGTGNVFPGSSSAEDASHRLWGTGHSSCRMQQHKEISRRSWGVHNMEPSSGAGIEEGSVKGIAQTHDDVIEWQHFPRYWPFVRGIHQSPVNSPYKGQWRGGLMFSLICALNKRLNKQWWGWWFQMPSRPLWCHCNGNRENKRSGFIIKILYIITLYFGVITLSTKP